MGWWCKLILISWFYPALTCESGDKGLQWYPENSRLLKSLGWNLQFFPDFPFPESDDDTGLESIHLFGGDVILDEENSQDQNAIAKKDKLWPMGKIPYRISSELKYQQKLIRSGMKNIENKTCIRFVPRTAEKNFIYIFQGNGCNSKIGMSGGAQNLSLARGCHRLGKVIHELVHALGFFHEQSRSDRDEYIDIHWENIQEGHEKNFAKLKPDQQLELTSYDYDSVMHYSEYAFSKDKKKGLKTMTAKKKGVILKGPSDKGLSPADIRRINILYSC